MQGSVSPPVIGKSKPHFEAQGATGNSRGSVPGCQCISFFSNAARQYTAIREMISVKSPDLSCVAIATGQGPAPDSHVSWCPCHAWRNESQQLKMRAPNRRR